MKFLNIIIYTMQRRRTDNPNTKKLYDDKYSALDPAQERSNDWMLPALMKHAPTIGKVLEVGCALGGDLAWLSKKNFHCNYVGYDFSSVAVDKANVSHGHFASFWAVNIMDMTDSNKFDFVFCSQTLEHLDDPKGAVANLARAVKKGGKLFITVPAWGGSLARVKNHVFVFEHKDFIKWLPKCVVKDIDRAHTLVVWEKK